MNGTPAEAAELARELRALLLDLPTVDVAVFPPSLAIVAVLQELRSTDIQVGGQDLHAQPQGAYTGNISGEMLRAAGCTTCLVGHSERRAYEGESGELLADKTAAALRAGLMPIFCVGESLDERSSGRTMEVVLGQLADGLGSLTESALGKVVIAYEPVWAIGTGEVASPEQAQEVHAAVRAWVGNAWSAGAARSMRILYGGSVKPANVAGIMAQPDVDGALVGGASLKADSFEAIVRFKQRVS
jgi:triosephosphate isomerase